VSRHCRIAPAVVIAVLALLATAVPGAIARAQAAPESWQTLRGGDTVRVWATRPPLSRTVAQLSRLASDTLALADVPGRRSLRTELAVPLESVTRLEVQRGRTRSVGWTVGGVLIGLAAGTIVGAYGGVALECGGSCSDQGDLAGILGFVVGGAVGGLAGGIIGGVIGAQRRTRWYPVALPPRSR
jgi:hypothetical protein